MTDPKLSARRTVRSFLEQMADANERSDMRSAEAKSEIVRLFRAAANFVENGGELSAYTARDALQGCEAFKAAATETVRAAR